jgi:Tfp pilus assembly protein PilV
MRSVMNRATDGPSTSTALRRSRLPRPADQAGFGLIEAIAAGAVLAVLALGVLAGIDGAAGSSGREKARAVAAALAEQDQERMHAMRAIDLPEYRNTAYPEVNGTKYAVTSEADWISDATGSPVSCQSNGGKADYLRLRTTVTSPTVGTRTAPVQLDSIVTPPANAAGGNSGTLAVKVQNRDDGPVISLPVTIVGENTGKTHTEPTNAVGCAIFPGIAADDYAITINSLGWVDPDGVQNPTKTSTVTIGGATLETLRYDQAGSLTATFDTQYWDPVVKKTWKVAASRAVALTLANAGMTVNGGQRTFPSSTSDPLLAHTATNLFPFKDGYGVFSGRCTEQNPSRFNSTWAGSNAFKLVDRLPAVASMVVRQPALPVRIFKGSWDEDDNEAFENQPIPFGGANVQAKLVGLATSSLCAAAPDTIKGITEDPVNGLQSYPALIPSYTGTKETNYADGHLGWVTRRAPGQIWTTGYFDPGLPWGTWQVCADDGVRRGFATVTNDKPNGLRNPAKTINLLGSGSQLGTCATQPWPTP